MKEKIIINILFVKVKFAICALFLQSSVVLCQINENYEQIAFDYFIQNIYSDRNNEKLVFSGNIENEPSTIENICLIEIIDEVLNNYRNKEVPLLFKTKNNTKININDKYFMFKSNNFWNRIFKTKRSARIKVFNKTQFLDWAFIEIQLIKPQGIYYYYFEIDMNSASVINYCVNKFYN